MLKEDKDQIKELLKKLMREYDDMCDYAVEVSEYSVDSSSLIFYEAYGEIEKLLDK